MAASWGEHVYEQQRQHDGDYYRAQRADAYRRREESWEWSDSDGFLSQWAAGETAAKHEILAQLADDNFEREVTAVFDLDGNFVPAVPIWGQYGFCWRLTDENYEGALGWFSPSKARNPETARRNNAKKGFYEGKVKAPCFMTPEGEIRRVQTLPFVVVDNGH